MTIMNTELYEALIEAGASDEKAKAASNMVEEQNKRFDKIDNRFDSMQVDIDHRFDEVENHFIIMQKEIDHRFDKADMKADNNFTLLDTKIDGLDSKIDGVEKILGAELTTIKWIGGAILSGVVAIFVRLVFYST